MLKGLQLISKIPGAKKAIKKSIKYIEEKSPGYKKLQDKLENTVRKKVDKNYRIKSQEDRDSIIKSLDKLENTYFKKKPKIFQEADKLKRGGLIKKNIGGLVGGQNKIDADGSGTITAKDFKLLRDGNKFVAKQYGGKIGK